MIPHHQNRILFLYMVPETGHQKAAEAIMKAASYMNPRVDCVSLEMIKYSYPVIGNVFNKMYLEMLKRAPGIWDYLYDNPDVEEITRDARSFLTQLSSFRTRNLLRKYQPKAVVCTQAVPAIAMAAEKRKGHLKVPLIGVVTDFGVHTYWIHPEIDLYLVGHEDVKKDLMKKGILENRIRVTGIPIMPSFGVTHDVTMIRHKLKMNPHKKTILVMGGSRGMGSLDELVAAIQTIPTPFQMIVICGRNRSMHKKILEAVKDKEDCHVFGYVKDMSPLMSASDLLITKPGGLSCSESLAKQLPLVLTNPIPGQEERNVRFLLNHQVAKFARTTEDLIHVVSDLLRHPKKIQAMRQRARPISKPHSAWEGARYIFDAINDQHPYSSDLF